MKHFALNNSENFRYMGSSTIDERAAREIYLKPFEICVKEAKPWLIMTSYNIINSVRASENIELMTKDLDQFIINTRNVQKEYGLSEVYAVYYENQVIGISFVNYHPEKGELKEDVRYRK